MKKIKTAFPLIIMLGTVVLFSCNPSADDKKTTGAAEDGPSRTETNQLPDFIITDVEGKIVNLNSFKGKKVFVNLWATWCPPCRAEIPSIEKLAGKVGNEEAAFVMIALDEQFDVAKQFAKTKNMKVPIYYPAQKLPALFTTEGIPATFIFDEKGNLVKQILGSDDYNTDAYYKLMVKNRL